MKYSLFFLLGFSWNQNSNAQSFTPPNMDTLSQYIFDQQYSDISQPSYGAIKKSKGEDIFSGQHYFVVEPYFNHIATLGMLKSNHPDKCGFALRWLNWYVTHLDGNGQTLNHYYKPDGTGETTCPPGATGIYCNHIDAEDSDPALFWTLAYSYYSTTNDLSFFTSSVKLLLEKSAQFVMDSLIQSDHLSIAKRSYPIEYTMDNSEVYKGFLSLSSIEAQIYNDTSKANLYSLTADRIKTAIRTLLYNNTTQLYDHYQCGATDSTQWYIDGVTATLWPQLFEVDGINDVRSVHQRQVLNNNFDGTPNPDWTTSAFLGTVDNFTWASVGYVFSLANDTLHGYAQAGYISDVFHSPFPFPPCYVADAGWCLMNMAVKYPPNAECGMESISENATGKFLISPNPASFYLHIQPEFDAQFCEIMIYTLQGNVVHKQKFNSVINVSMFPPGFYFIRLIEVNTNKSYSQKFIKN